MVNFITKLSGNLYHKVIIVLLYVQNIFGIKALQHKTLWTTVSSLIKVLGALYRILATLYDFPRALFKVYFRHFWSIFVDLEWF